MIYSSRLKSLSLTACWIRSRFVKGGLILLYHRVIDNSQGRSEIDQTTADPFSIVVTADHFAQHLDILRQTTNPLSLPDLVKSALQGRLPQRAVAITFDDGYLDNLTHAKPLLERFQIPATFFITTGFIGQPFWWDEIVRYLIEPKELPSILNLNLNGQFHSWKLNKQNIHSRIKIVKTIHRLLRPLIQAKREIVLSQLANWSGLPHTLEVPNRALKTKEIHQLGKGNLIEIGAHTVTHPPLARHSLEMQKQEIVESKHILENIVGKPVTSFAYPYGLPIDYNSDTINSVQEAGFELACINFFDVIWKGSDPYQLPRHWVRDWPAQEFIKHLNRWLPIRSK